MPIHRNGKQFLQSYKQEMHLKETLGTCTTSMHHSLRDPLSIKLRDLFHQLVVLEKDGSCNIRKAWTVWHEIDQRLKTNVGLQTQKDKPRTPTVSDILLFHTGAPEFVVQ